MNSACKSEKTQIIHSSKEVKVFTTNIVAYEALLKALKIGKIASYTCYPK